MAKKMERRDFIKTGSVIGTAALLGGTMTGELLFSSEKEILSFASVLWIRCFGGNPGIRFRT